MARHDFEDDSDDDQGAPAPVVLPIPLLAITFDEFVASLGLTHEERADANFSFRHTATGRPVGIIAT